ncbi:transcription termination factor NusA [uncultured Porphyromonas sp.]|uniref:transcription termination factor NusA n=1 Tax=uncultured Porphyromonas sp. TaxID=159274 RepID=UPI00261BEFB5|nr:transcription termination factor NusA [uncultured Porphyromonas sp.]
MARKKEATSLKVLLTEFKELKNIDEETMLHVLEDSFRSILAKMFGSDDNFDVIINADSGDFEIWRTREVVADDAVERENEQVAYTEAREIDPEAEIGDDVTDSVDFLSFGRRAIVNLRQTLSSKILDLQKEHFYQAFIERVGEMITAEVYQVWKRETLLVDEDGNELIMPKSEQIPDEYFRKGDSVHAVIARVDNENNNPRVTLSRTSPEFLKRLFEINVPEIADGLITIKRVARIPGVRAKIAVESYDDRIDPVGSCVGMNGSRIRGIVRELHGENIDVLTYTSNDSLFIQRALSPAKVSSIKLYPETAKAEVYLQPEDVPLAIGKNASNIKLASVLTGFEIEVFRDAADTTEEDIYLSEFSDEIEDWVIKMLLDIGLNTARAVLTTSRTELLQRTDLEIETIDHVLRILSSEFDLEELEEMGLPQENIDMLKSPVPTQREIAEAIIEDLKEEPQRTEPDSEE